MNAKERERRKLINPFHLDPNKTMGSFCWWWPAALVVVGEKKEGFSPIYIIMELFQFDRCDFDRRFNSSVLSLRPFCPGVTQSGWRDRNV